MNEENDVADTTTWRDESARLGLADKFHAFVEIRPEQPSASGRLARATVAAKDNIKVRGLPFTAGHDLFRARVADTNAVAVSRLRAAGARILGVTRTDAGGFGVTTPEVLNPIAPNHVAGGSSGGAAAAVAANLADIGLGTDTGGSSRIPAACCGIFGFKPSFARIPCDGIWPLAPTLDHVGVMARDLTLLQIATETLVDDSLECGLQPLEIGVDETRINACDASVRDCFLAVIAELRQTGQSVTNIRLPEHADVAHAHGVQVLTQARQVYAPFWPQKAERLGRAARRALRMADGLDAATIRHAEQRTKRINAAMDDIFTDLDVVLGPTLAIPPPRSDERYVHVGSKQMPVLDALVMQPCLANLAGLPALAMPLPAGPLRLPHSLQITARRGRDDLAFSCARMLFANCHGV